jgi:tetratricopeptide (TPR) repeat protein
MRRLLASAALALVLAACGGGLEPLPRRADAVHAPLMVAAPDAAAQLGEPAVARARFEAQLARDPDELSALNDLAITYFVEGRPEAARQLLDEVVAQGTPREQQAALVNLAALYARDGYLAAAVAHCEVARDMDPSRPEPHYVLALLDAARGDRAGALANVELALRLDGGGVARESFLHVPPEARAALDALAGDAQAGGEQLADVGAESR